MGYVMGKLGEEMEREPGSQHQPLDLAGTQHLLNPLRRHSGNGTAPPKRQGQAEGLRHSPFFCAMGQKRVLQAWEAAGFWCAEQPTAGRRPARHCTDLVCMPPPQLAVHCGKHKQESPGPPGPWVSYSRKLHPRPPTGSSRWSASTNHCGWLSRFWIFPRYGHWGEVPRSLNVLESSRV